MYFRYDSDNSVDGYHGHAREPVVRPHVVTEVKPQYNKPAYDELLGQVQHYLHNIETEDYQDIALNKEQDYLSDRVPVRYLVSGPGKQIVYDGKRVVYDDKQVVYDKSGLGFVLERPRQDYTPIHEDYPDIPPPERSPSPEPPVPGPTQAYILSPTPSPTPGYITPKPIAYSLTPASSPSPNNFLVLPHQVKHFQYS